MVIAGVVAAGVLSSCSSGRGTDPQAPAPQSAADEIAIATVFRDHNAALLAHDFAKVCSLNDAALNEQLVANSAAGGQVGNCEDAVKKIYTNPEAVATSDGIARTAQITGIRVDGDTARITWSVQGQGTQSTADTDMRRIGKDWRLTGSGPAK